MRGEKSRRGRRSTTKKGRTAVWDIGHRRSLLHRWGRLSPATLCWLRRPQPQTRSRKVSYDLVREERGQVNLQRPASNAVLQRCAIQKLHGDERLAILLANFVDSADI